MAHGKRILIREMFRELARFLGDSPSKEQPSVKRKTLLRKLIQNDPYKGTTSQRNDRNERLLDRYLKGDKHIEKTLRGSYRIRIQPSWLTEIAYQHRDELRDALERYREFFHDVDASLDKALTPEAEELRETFRAALEEMLSMKGDDMTTPFNFDGSDKAHFRFEMRSRKVEKRLTKTYIGLKREFRKMGRSSDGSPRQLPAKAWHKFISDINGDMLFVLESFIGNKRDQERFRKAVLSQTGRLADLDIPKILAGTPTKDLFSALGKIIDDVVDILDQVLDEGPYAFKSHRDQRLHLPGWALFKALLNQIVGKGGSP